MKKTMLVMAIVIALAMSTMGAALASGPMLEPFTQAELDNNWVADRQYPSGGVESVSAYGRDDVAAIGVVGAEQFTPTSGSTFYYFEGIKKVDDFGPSVQVDLYVPAEWETAATSPANVGLWTYDDPPSAYPLIVFRNGDEVDAGFYTYTYNFDEDGEFESAEYVASGVDVNYGGWNTLSIALDTTAGVANYAINGQEAGDIAATGDTIAEVFLNHYNDGEFDYTAYWHAGIPSADDCKNGGFEDLGFRNQGQCIASFQAADNAIPHFSAVGDWDMDLFTSTTNSVPRFIVIESQLGDGAIEGVFGVGYDSTGNPTGTITGEIDNRDRTVMMTYERTDNGSGYTADFTGTIDGPNTMSGTWSDSGSISDELWTMTR